MALTDSYPIERRMADRRRSTPRADSVCHVPSDQVVAMRASHVAEVQALQRRVDALEHALAQAEATHRAHASPIDSPAITSIELPTGQNRRRSDELPLTPDAQIAVEHDTEDSAEHNAKHNGEAVLDEMASTVTSGASAWDDDDVSFAERVAARAFFRSDTSDERARRWLLRDK